jgi:hypothetical protein
MIVSDFYNSFYETLKEGTDSKNNPLLELKNKEYYIFTNSTYSEQRLDRFHIFGV